MNWRFSPRNVSAIYVDVQKFLDDMRAGRLPEGFTLVEDVFGDLCSMANADKELATELAGYGLIMVLEAKDKSEIEGLLAIAEASREG